MSSRAIDIATIMKALNVTNQELNIPYPRSWKKINDQQLRMFHWWEFFNAYVENIHGLTALSSSEYELLNQFLVENQFYPMVEPFEPDLGIGVVSILDKLVQWLHGPGTVVDISTSKGVFPGFELTTGINFYRTPHDQRAILIEVLTTSKDTLWLYCNPTNTQLENLDLAAQAIKIMDDLMVPATTDVPYFGEQPQFGQVHIPMVDLETKPDISWLIGALAETDHLYSIRQAHQEFKIRMDRTGARAKVATVVVTMRESISHQPETLVIDKPFYGWFTQEGFEKLPLALFYADYDSWKKPHGSLKDM